MIEEVIKKVVLFLVAAAAALTSGSVPEPQNEAGSDRMSFIHADGRSLCDENGKEFIIKGMAFGNNVWDNPSVPPSDHHSESSYKELSGLGFNSVRFYLNYGLFESDDAAYFYKRSGFEWIDTNIEAAKKYGIRLVLNMHYPQGGYQSGGKGDALWTNSENRSRLKALWTEIAKRYADEPAILGYGLVNEPVPVGRLNSAEAVELWRSFAQETVNSIRKYDTKHLVFIEKCNPKPYPGGQTDWSVKLEYSIPKIKGDNIVYEFHTYDPFFFTHQQFDWAGTEDQKHTYPENGKGKDELKASLKEVIKLSEDRNAPIYCGEFGAGRHCFENDRGGALWVSDMLDILIENKISFNYHTFNEYSFGFYYPENGWGRLVRNDELAEVFKKKLSV